MQATRTGGEMRRNWPVDNNFLSLEQAGRWGNGRAPGSALIYNGTKSNILLVKYGDEDVGPHER